MDYRIEEIIISLENDLPQTRISKHLAKSINLSVSRFQHLFKKETGKSIMQYVGELRVRKARRLLETSCLRVKEVRIQVGATNEKLFLRHFSEICGETPSEYRKNFRNSRNCQKIAELTGK